MTKPFLSYSDKKHRTKASVLVANFDEVTSRDKFSGPSTLSTGHIITSYDHVYMIAAQEVYTRKAIFSVSPDGSECTIQRIDMALGDWSAHSSISITKDQMSALNKVRIYKNDEVNLTKEQLLHLKGIWG